MTSFLNWFVMGGYSFYVWSSYGVVCLALLMGYLSCRMQKNKIHRQLTQWLKRTKE